ncbi:MAG: hypothetical protein ABEI76_02090 [Halobacteriales archaeon]
MVPDRTIRWLATLVQLSLATVLLVSHLWTTAPYVYPHYVVLILVHPFVLRRIVGIRLSAWQICYISGALVAHPIGGLYGFYATVWWYDHLTHTLSATLVAAIGFILIRTYTLKTGGRRWLIPVFTMAFVLTGGFIWEIVELHVEWLTVYGYNDTVLDYVFNTLGGLLVVVVGPHVLRRHAVAVVENQPLILPQLDPR